MITFLFQMEEDKDKEFLINIYKNYYPFIKKRIMAAVSSEDVEDCIQDCFVRLIRNVEQMQTLLPQQITAYIYRTLQSVIIDYKKKKKLLVIEYDIDTVPDHEVQSSVEQEIEEKAVYERFFKGFYSLPEVDQIILRCLYQQEIDRNDLAKMLGIKPSSIRTYISRAKKHALQLLRGDTNEK